MQTPWENGQSVVYLPWKNGQNTSVLCLSDD